MITLKVPTGIGDIAWVLQKLYLWEDRPEIKLKVAKEQPRRSLPFLELLPWLDHAEYDDHLTTRKVLDKGSVGPDFIPEDGQEYFIHANHHLQAGKHISEFMPRLPTAYTFPVDMPYKHRLEYNKNILVYPSSDRAERNYLQYGGWSLDVWHRLLQMINHDYPGYEFILTGAEWDRSMVDLLHEKCYRSGIISKKVIGHHISEVFDLMYKTDYFFSFPSGLGIMADIMGACPCTMFMPNNLEKMIGTFGNPSNFADKIFNCMLFPVLDDNFFQNIELRRFLK